VAQESGAKTPYVVSYRVVLSQVNSFELEVLSFEDMM
jgi:hypothetical protein